MTAVSLLSDSQEVDFSLYLISISMTAGLLEAKNIANSIGKNISFGILYFDSWVMAPLSTFYSFPNSLCKQLKLLSLKALLVH